MKKILTFCILIFSIFLVFSFVQGGKPKEYWSKDYESDFEITKDENGSYFVDNNYEKLNGKCKFIYTNYNPSFVIETTLKDGKPVGSYLEYFEHRDSDIKIRGNKFKGKKIMEWDNKYIVKNANYNKKNKLDGEYIHIKYDTLYIDNDPDINFENFILNRKDRGIEKQILEHRTYKNGKISSDQKTFTITNTLYGIRCLSLYKQTKINDDKSVITYYFKNPEIIDPENELDEFSDSIMYSQEICYSDDYYFSLGQREKVNYLEKIEKNSKYQYGIMAYKTEERKYETPNNAKPSELTTEFIKQTVRFYKLFQNDEIERTDIVREITIDKNEKKIIIKDYFDNNLIYEKIDDEEHFNEYYDKNLKNSKDFVNIFKN